MIIADTGFWLALANRADRHHEKASAALRGIREELVTTWPVLTETCHLLATRLGVPTAERFVERGAAGAFRIFDLSSGAPAARVRARAKVR